MEAAKLKLEGFEGGSGKLAKPCYRVGVTIYPHCDPVFANRETRPRKLTWKAEETEGSVVGWQWSKRLGQPSGTWAATVKLGRRATISPMGGDVLGHDWADCSVLRNGVVFPICRGVIDTVRESTQAASGETVRTLTLTGKDHGGLMETPIAWNNIYVETMKELGFGLMTFKILSTAGDPPDKLFADLIAATFNRGTSQTQSGWALPPALQAVGNAKAFCDLINVDRGVTRGGYFNQQSLWTTAGQTLDQAVAQWCNPLLNEWRYDIGQGVTANQLEAFAAIRERPFVNTTDGMASPWFGLRTWRIPTWLVEGTDLGRSDTERFTIFQLIADVSWYPQAGQAALTVAEYSRYLIERYGIKPYMEQTNFIGFAEDPSQWIPERDRWLRLLIDWYAPNPYWLSGTINFGCMLPEVQIGDRLILDTGNPTTCMQAYVEGVSHTFQWAGSGSSGPRTRTSLSVTRGFHGTDGNLLKMVRDITKLYKDKST
jgi:hypothetical protein